ncbi:MAG TPA: DMT family transporter [Candidatus Limnocylindrales bacterium]|nr:DMT family transporter [Candidatus Limnocylindrales bacterium]
MGQGRVTDAPSPAELPTHHRLARLVPGPRLAALLGAMCIAFSGIFYREALVSPSTAAVFRCFYGLPVLVAVAVWERRRFGPLPPAAWRLAVVAGVFFAGDLLFWHHAIEQVGAGLATVLGNMQILVVAVVAWLVLGESPTVRSVAAIPVVLVGAVMISGVVGQGAYGANPLLGVVFGTVTAFCYAGYLLVIRHGGRDVRRPGGPVAIATASTMVIAALVGAIGGDLSLAPSWPAHGWLVAYGVTSQSLGYLLISLSLPRLPATLTSTILLSQPVATVGLAMVLLGESPSVIQLLGVALIVGGIALATVNVRPMMRRTATRPSPSP